MEQKVCKNCNQQFVIEQQDLKFYDRVASPIPKYCPSCRMQRRLAHRNERTLYRRSCDLCKKDMVAIYPSNTPWPVYCHECWWSDKWDPKDFGMAYDPQKAFLEQFGELQKKVPRIALLSITSVNSEYTNNSADNKNCYLIFAAEQNEDCLYGRLVQRSRLVMDVAFTYDSELSYECVDCRKCNNCLFSERCQSSIDLLFCFNVRDSQNCIFGINSRYQTYTIEGKKVNKEEFERKKREILASSTSLQKAKRYFEELKSRALVKYAFQTKCVNATGDYLFNCHDSRLAYDAENTKDCAYLADIAGATDCCDGNNMYYTPELCYDLMGIIKCYKSKHSGYIFYCNGVEYCDNCYNAEHCFGSIGLRKAKYCILNREYSKEEYEKLKKQIVDSMEKEGTYGQFFPPSLSPFVYNETLAKDYLPFPKEEGLKKGFRWQDQETGTYGKETIKKDEMPSTIEEVGDDILNEVLACEDCGKNFRIIKPELDFYRKMHLSLPRKDFECRHQARMAKRTPRTLWHRSCQCAGRTSDLRPTTNDQYQNTISHFHKEKHCPNEFETSYSLQRSEIVYCEQCYIAEVA
ncbi:MAG: hypothetical protein HY001_02410 [Candidatus Portnoybacteria bacterium]|nr:hypothetical protein [Candidatus Portnoybacteria bacterium]